MSAPSPLGSTPSAGERLAWSRPREALAHLVRGRTARVAAPVAAVVGTVLSAANEGSSILAGRLGTAGVARLVVNFVVPFLVASWGALSTHRRGVGNTPDAERVTGA